MIIINNIHESGIINELFSISSNLEISTAESIVLKLKFCTKECWDKLNDLKDEQQLKLVKYIKQINSRIVPEDDLEVCSPYIVSMDNAGTYELGGKTFYNNVVIKFKEVLP